MFVPVWHLVLEPSATPGYTFAYDSWTHRPPPPPTHTQNTPNNPQPPQAAKVAPKDPDLRKKLSECERAVKRIKFEEALSTPVSGRVVRGGSDGGVVMFVLCVAAVQTYLYNLLYMYTCNKHLCHALNSLPSSHAPRNLITSPLHTRHTNTHNRTLRLPM